MAYAYISQSSSSGGGGGGGGSSTQTWTKVAKTYTNFSVADITSKVTLMTLPANTVIKHILINATITFDDGSMNTATVGGIGVTGNDQALYPTLNSPPSFANLGLLGAGGNNSGFTYEFSASHSNGVLEYLGAYLYSVSDTTPITLTLNAMVNFDTFTQGAFTTYICTDTLPS